MNADDLGPGPQTCQHKYRVGTALRPQPRGTAEGTWSYTATPTLVPVLKCVHCGHSLFRERSRDPR